MAGRRRAQPSGQQGALPVEDYRHAGATRPNNPPAAIAAEGRTLPASRTSYAYTPRLDPALRAAPSRRGGALPPLLEKATREKLTAEEAAPLAEAHVLLSCMGRIMQKTFSKRVSSWGKIGA